MFFFVTENSPTQEGEEDGEEEEEEKQPEEVPSTPARAARNRRTRSCTRSPSPVPRVEEIQPNLCPVPEEEEMETVKEVEETVEDVEMETIEEKVHSPKPEHIDSEQKSESENENSSDVIKDEVTTKPESDEPEKEIENEDVKMEEKPEKPEIENESKTDESSKETEKEVEDKERSERRSSRWANNAADDKNSRKSNDHESDDRRRSDRRGEKRQRSSEGGNKRDSRSDRRTPPKNQPAPNIDDFLNEEDEPTIADKTVGLSWFDSDLHLKIDSTDFSSAKPLSDAALCLTWAGARTNYGIKEGKVLYEVQVTGHNNFNNYPDEKFPYELRCGFSTDKTDLQLGERLNSFAYGGSGQKSVNNEFSEYGCTFGLDDVVGVYLNLESFPCTIQYTVNGKEQGIAFEFNKTDLEGEALFPHISSKNVSFKANFGQMTESLLSLVKPKKLVKKVVEAKKKSEEKKVEEEKKVDEKEELENGSEEKVEEKKDVEVKEKEDSIKEDESEKVTEPVANKEEEISEPKEIEEEQVAEIVETKEVEEEKIDEPVVADKAVEEEEDKVEEKVSEEKSEDVEMKEPEVEEKVIEDEAAAEEEEVTEPEPVVPLTLLPEYEYISKVEEDKLCSGPIRPDSRKECEAIMMIGLPGSGKTHWASNLSKENPEKYFNILGTHTLLEKMKVCLFNFEIFMKKKI